MIILTLILAAAAGYGVAVKWGSGISPVSAVGIGTLTALLTSIVFAVIGLGGLVVLLLSVGAGAGAVYALRSRNFGNMARSTSPVSSAGDRQSMPSRPASGSSATTPAPEPDLPEPDRYSSDAEAGAAMNAVGDIQRRFDSGTMSNAEVAVMGEDISRKCQGIMEYFISQGREVNLYNTVVEPICSWAIGQLAPIWIIDQGAAPHSAAAKRAYFDITALMEKYEQLKPSS
ncbi:hypothetical protein AB0P16_11855 [Dietzia maris]|uniref:hypothetical protein n=1 Tax=Dietzia maris TaxID=37915 RepID=UPI003423B30E